MKEGFTISQLHRKAVSWGHWLPTVDSRSTWPWMTFDKPLIELMTSNKTLYEFYWISTFTDEVMYLLSTNLQWDVVQITACRVPVHRAGGRVCNRHYRLTPKALNTWGCIFIYSWNMAMAAGKKRKKMNNNKHK